MKHRAFTIVELCVAMGVVGVLIALLLPALAGVSSSSRSARCQMNLKQMAVAAYNYAAMFDAFPAAVHYENNGSGLRTVMWDWVFVNNQVASPGTLWNFADNPGEVMQCPDYFGPPNTTEPYTGYNYNTTYIGAEAQFPNLGWANIRKGVPPHACNRASLCAMFGDGGYKAGSNRYMRAPLRSEGLSVSLQAIYSGGQAFRHGGCTNIAFIDGHTGSCNHPCKGNLATDSLLNQMGFPNNGFLSDDDSAYNPR